MKGISKVAFVIVLALALSIISINVFSSSTGIKISVKSKNPLKLKIVNAQDNSYLEIHDSNGNKIDELTFTPMKIPKGTIFFYEKDLPAGNYKIKLTSGKISITKDVTIENSINQTNSSTSQNHTLGAPEQTSEMSQSNYIPVGGDGGKKVLGAPKNIKINHLKKIREIQRNLKPNQVYHIITSRKLKSPKNQEEHLSTLKFLKGKDDQGNLATETAIGKNFVLSSYDTLFELVSHHSSPLSVELTYRIYNDKPKNYTYVAVATSGELKEFRAWHYINKTKQVYRDNITYYQGNQTSKYKDAPILEYIPPYYDNESGEMVGNVTKVGYPYNETVVLKIKQLDNPQLITKTTNFLEKWNNGYFDNIKSELKSKGVEYNLSLLDEATLPDSNQLVYIYEVPHKQNTWEYFSYKTTNSPSKFLALDPAGGTWWNESWKYRMNITINNQVASDLTNYTLLIKLNSTNVGSNFNWTEDKNATRFTYYNSSSDNETSIPYWIESWNSTSEEAKIWVKVPYIPASGSSLIYLYYGNPSASSESNGTATFLLFDEGNQTSSWTLAGSSGQTTTEGNPEPSYYAVSSRGDYMYRDIGLTPGSIVTFNVKSNGLGNLFFLTDSSGAGQMYRSDTRGGNDYSGFATTSSWTSWNAPSSGFTSTANAWYKFTIVIKDSTTADLYYSKTTDFSPSNFGTLVGTFTITNNGGYIGLVGDALGSSHTTWWDNLIVRKYAKFQTISHLKYQSSQ